MKFKVRKKSGGATKRRKTAGSSNGNGSSSVDEAVSGKSWMKTGFQAAKREMKRNEARRGSWTPEFWLKDGESADIRLLTDEPMCLYQHRVAIGTQKYAPRTCLGEGNNCPLCKVGNKRQFVGVFKILDRREEKWTSKDGKAHAQENTVKVWRCGQRILGQLEALHAKKGDLTSYDINMTRNGKGLETTYLPIPDAPEKLSKADRKKRDETKIDLEKVLAPKSRTELLAEMGASGDEGDVADDME